AGRHFRNAPTVLVPEPVSSCPLSHVRRILPATAPWDDLRVQGLPKCDAVVNLAGKHILNLREKWDESYRQELLASRISTTRSLVAAINHAKQPPEVFISTAGKCFYGTPEQTNGAEYPELDEYSKPMHLDYAAELVSQWEAAADELDSGRVRHVRLRIGIVLGRTAAHFRFSTLALDPSQNGIMPVIHSLFSVGVGAVIGHGKQPVPWIHIDDMVRLLVRTITDSSMQGRYNAVAPGIVSNREFTRVFTRLLKRPMLWSAPRWLIRFIVGEQRASILLEGQNIVPRRTLAAGFRFQYPELTSALSNLVGL
ncbi:MAG: TIGR01777 family oxidoreductase, partial [Pseudomonadota bacterium]